MSGAGGDWWDSADQASQPPSAAGCHRRPRGSKGGRSAPASQAGASGGGGGRPGRVTYTFAMKTSANTRGCACGFCGGKDFGMDHITPSAERLWGFIGVVGEDFMLGFAPGW
eukprot:1262218-Pyramimonas_sp.AAC.1